MPVTLKEELERHISLEEKANPEVSRGGDWFELTEEEEFVFGIENGRWNRMAYAFWCWKIFLGVAHFEGEDAPLQLLKAERAARPDIFDKGRTVAGFRQFAREYAALTSREASAAYAKMRFWNERAKKARSASIEQIRRGAFA